MRLAPLRMTPRPALLAGILLAGSALLAQGASKLPWEEAPPLPWKAADCGPPPPPPLPAAPAQGPLAVRITSDGALRILDAKGIIRLRTGLPGRPLRVWRDGGMPVERFTQPLAFAAESPASKGLGSLPIGAPDFRPGLAGLLWILCDDARVITLVHPATARVAYLPLPGTRNFRVCFFPDHFEVREAPPSGGSCWSVPWLALLPHLIQLGLENPANRPSGTALNPYPKE